SRRIRSEEIPHWPEVKIQLLLNHSWLHNGPSLLGIDLEDTVEMLRHIDYNRIGNRLARETGAGAAGQHRYFELACRFHGRKNVFVSTGNHDADRFDFINAGVGAVHQT